LKNHNIKIFFGNWILFFLSFIIIAAIIPDEKGNLIFIFAIAGGLLGGLYSFVNYVDDTESLYSYKWLSIVGGFFFLTGISFPIFYLKRQNLSIIKSFAVLLTFPFIISMAIGCLFAIGNYFLYPPVELKDLKDNIYFVVYLSILSPIPTLLLGFFNPKARKQFINNEAIT